MFYIVNDCEAFKRTRVAKEDLQTYSNVNDVSWRNDMWCHTLDSISFKPPDESGNIPQQVLLYLVPSYQSVIRCLLFNINLSACSCRSARGC